jgi:hypothetical protein
MGPAEDDPRSNRTAADRALLGALLVVAGVMASRTIVDVDLPGHLAYGLVHLRTGHLPATDPYSYTAQGAPWINHEWAFEWLIALVYTRTGGVGLVALQAAAWGGAAVVVLGLLRRQTRDLLPGALLFVAYAGLSYPSISIRPQLVTFLAFALLLLALERARAGRAGWLLGVPLLVGVWTNFHGGWLAGLGVLGLYAGGLLVDALLRRPVHGPTGDAPLPRRTALLALAATAAAAAASLVNPYGLGLHRWLAWSLAVPNPHVSEWTPIGLDLDGAAVVGLVLLVGAALVLDRRRVPVAHALCLAATALLAVRHVRHVPFLAMEACAFAGGPVARLLRRVAPPPADDLPPDLARRVQALALALACAAVGLRVGLFDVRPRLTCDPSAAWPTGALPRVDDLVRARARAHAPPLRLLAFFDWAQLAIWRWAPLVQVHYDGRHRTVYGLDVEAAHFGFLDPDPPADWARLLDRAEAVLVPRGSFADRRMRGVPGWRLDYEDGVAALFVPGPGPAPVEGPAHPGPLPFETRLGEE